MSNTLADSLQIEPHSTVWVSDPAHIALLTPMPDGVRESDHLATASTAIIFAESAESAREQLQSHADDLAKPATLWVACPAAEVDRDALVPVVAGFGLRPDTEVRLDDTWSATCLRKGA